MTLNESTTNVPHWMRKKIKRQVENYLRDSSIVAEIKRHEIAGAYFLSVVFPNSEDRLILVTENTEDDVVKYSVIDGNEHIEGVNVDYFTRRLNKKWEESRNFRRSSAH